MNTITEGLTKPSRSLLRTLDRFQMKRDLIKMWEAAGTDPDYVAQLRRDAFKLRNQLQAKGVIVEEDGEL
jgi:hypothetical protein